MLANRPPFLAGDDDDPVAELTWKFGELNCIFLIVYEAEGLDGHYMEIHSKSMENVPS